LRLLRLDPFANLRLYGLRDSFGVMVNYRYIPEDLAENHERFIQSVSHTKEWQGCPHVLRNRRAARSILA
jgi:hypothetical protein